jgi:Peptidase C39 family
MASGAAAPAFEDTGLDALILLLRFHEIAVDLAQIRHQHGAAAFGIADILRCAKQFRLKARAVSTGWERLAKTSLPALAQARDGSFVILGKVLDDKALIQDPRVGRPELVGRADFEARWSGRLVLIARGLIGNPRILIFDEPTSALDCESERRIQDNMRRIAHGRTVLIIAHRLSAVPQADRIITVQRGRIVDDSNDAELIARGGRYAALHRMQAEGAGMTVRRATEHAACAPAYAPGPLARRRSAPLLRRSPQGEGGSGGAGRGEGVYPRMALPIVEALPTPTRLSASAGQAPPSPFGSAGQARSAHPLCTWGARGVDSFSP